jgi:HAD superfamily hydrolase (TIGR01490 family)
MRRAAAIFDLDGTLLGGASAEMRLVRRALGDGALPVRRVAAGLVRAAWARARGRTPTLAACKAWFAGAPCAPLEALAVDVVYVELAPRLRPGLLAAMAEHRAGGACIVLLTGTPDLLAAPLARFLQVDVWAASRLERAAGHFTGRLAAPHPHGAGKRRLLLELAARHDLDLAASHAWADRTSDALHLDVVGRPHAVAPDRGLRRLARARGWSIVEADDAGGGESRAAGAGR